LVYTWSNQVDEYSKSGPKTAQSIRSAEEREMQARMKRLLALKTEGDFVRQLRVEAGVGPEHPYYLRMVKL
jgi:hypothetical protein